MVLRISVAIVWVAVWWALLFQSAVKGFAPLHREPSPVFHSLQYEQRWRPTTRDPSFSVIADRGHRPLVPFSKDGSRRQQPNDSRNAINSFRMLRSSKGGDLQDSNNGGGLQKENPFRKAINRFKTRPGTYLIIPVIAALVGWITNWMAVQMIFYPIQFRGIPLYIRDEVPLGLLGWQGIVPCKTRKMSEAMVEMVTSQLLTVHEAFHRLDPKQMARLLSSKVPELAEDVMNDMVPKKWMTSLPQALFLGLPSKTKQLLSHMNFRFLENLAKDLIQNSESLFDIQTCVQTQMLKDRSLLGQLFRKCGQKELDFLTNSGLWFGFLLGLIQMVVALFWENPWTLSVGGAIVGYATNWLALKWIFEPVNPTKVGPFILHGQFLRRQKEVSAEFSKFFANRILTSQQVWHSILTDPTTSPGFYAMFARHFSRFVHKVKDGLQINVEPEVITGATNRAMYKLPKYIPVLHSYIDKAMGLEQTLRVKMEHMTSSQFERVLHPIFEEDELTLILAGAVLGFAAGLVQQGLATGYIKLPKMPGIWTPLATWTQVFMEKIHGALRLLRKPRPSQSNGASEGTAESDSANNETEGDDDSNHPPGDPKGIRPK